MHLAPASLREERFMEFLMVAAPGPDWGRVRQLREFCFRNGHKQEHYPRLDFISDTPDRGRWIASCEKDHLMEPGRYGPGRLREFVSNPLSQSDLEYLRNLQVSSESLSARKQRVYGEIQADLDKKYPTTISPTTGRRSLVSIRATYATPVPAHRPLSRDLLGQIRLRGSSRVASGYAGVRRPSTQSGRNLGRVPSIELLDGPDIRQVEIQLFTTDTCKASIRLPVGPQDLVIRMADHSTQWAKHGVSLTEVLMVLVLDDSSMPVWSPVRLYDWVATIRPRPFIAAVGDVHPTHGQLRNLYKHAYSGSLTAIA